MAKTAFILGHYNGRIAGNLGVLQDYLRRQGYSVKLLLHPLDQAGHSSTSYSVDGEYLDFPRRSSGLKGIPRLLGDLWLSVKIIRKSKMDIFIGTNNFDTFPAVICRKILRKHMPLILYYPRDYAENRYANYLLNQIYYWLEHVAVKYSDATISYTHRAETKRLHHGLISKKSYVIPNIVSLANPSFQPKVIRKDHFIYSGDVSREHGLYEFIQTTAPLIKKLVVIGSGPDWDRTIQLAQTYDFELEVHHGKDRDFVMDYLQHFNGIGLAPYNLTKRWTYYASPLKVTEYISRGVPVLMSNVPEIAEQIARDDLGVVFHRLSLSEIKEKIAEFDTSKYEEKSKRFYQSHTPEASLSVLLDTSVSRIAKERIATIIIPVHNGAGSFPKSFETIKAQNNLSLIDTVIVVDDGSKDNSEEVIKAALEDTTLHTKFIQHRRANGLSATYNEAINLSKTDFVITMHQDVQLTGNCAFDSLLAPLIDNADVAATYPIITHSEQLWLQYGFWQKCLFSRYISRKGSNLTGKFDAFRVSSLKAVGLFDTEHYRTAGEDADIRIRLAKKGMNCVASDTTIVHAEEPNEIFSIANWFHKEAQYAQARGAVLRLHGIQNVASFAALFFRELLILGLLIPYFRYVDVVIIFAYAFAYSALVYKTQAKNPRIIALPFVNIFLLILNSYSSIKAFCVGKETI